MRGYKLLFVYLLAALAPACGAAAGEPRPAAERFADWLSHSPQQLHEEDVSGTLASGLLPATAFLKRPWAYDDLKDYYRKNAELLARLLKLPRPGKFDTVLAPYEGELKLSSYDVHALPPLLITPERSFIPSGLRFSRLSVHYRGRTIQGLRLYLRALSFNMFGLNRTTAEGKQALTMPFISTLNARLLGLNAAQFIPNLSTPVYQPAEKFEYLGLRDWSSHARLKARTQFEGPVSLSNSAHRSGERYVISMHPDFALQTDIAAGERAVLSFFLWREAQPAVESLPDCLLQISLDLPAAGPQSESKRKDEQQAK